MNDPLPAKKDVALALLERSSVFVHLDPRRKGAVVPPNFKKQAQLVLQIGLNMAVQIPDLRFDDEGMSCTLSFSQRPFFCVVPWPAVFAMVGDDGRGMVWPTDVPAEIQQSGHEGRHSGHEGGHSGHDGAERPPRAPPGRRSKRKGEERPRPKLVAVPNDPAPAPDEAPRSPARTRKAGPKAPADPLVKVGPRKHDGAAAKEGPSRGPAPEEATLERPARPRPAPDPRRGKPKRELPPYLRVVK